MKKILKIAFLILIASNSFGQQFSNLYGDYLGQKLPCDTPVVFAPDIVSTVNLEHSSIQFNENGDLAVWCTIDNKIKKIMQMERIDNRWTQPIALDLFGDDFEIGNASPFLKSDGKTMYFGSEREKVKNPSNIESEWIKNTNTDLWVVDKIGSGWSKPTKLDTIINKGISEFHISVANSGNVYFVSYLPGAMNDCGIFYSIFKDDKYQKSKPLPIPVDENFQNWTPYVSPDESYLIYSKCVSKGDYGDLYIIYYDQVLNKWSKPQNLGEPINTRKQERFPYITPDDKYLFFTRPRKGHSQDIWWVKADNIIKKLKSTAIYE